MLFALLEGAMISSVTYLMNAVTHLWKLLLHTPEVHVSRPFQRGLCAAVLEEVAQPDASPVSG